MTMSERKIFAPEGATCKKCGGPLAFYKNERDNWVPCNPDGSDHWDDCRSNLNEGKYGIYKEAGPDYLFNPDTDITKPSHNRPLYTGDAPPWEI